MFRSGASRRQQQATDPFGGEQRVTRNLTQEIGPPEVKFGWRPRQSVYIENSRFPNWMT